MRRNLFLAAKCGLAAGCLCAAVLLVAPVPQASPRFLAARDARLHAASAGRMLAQASPTPKEAAIPVPPTAPAEPPDHRLAATDAAPAPLSGLNRARAVASPSAVSLSAAPWGATGGSSASAERRQTPALADEPPVAPIQRPTAAASAGLVPEPTPDPAPVAMGGLADEVRALREEVLRLTQAKPEKPAGAAADVADEVRQLLDELRETERFRNLEEQIRMLRGQYGGPSGGVAGDGATASSTAPPTPPVPRLALATPAPLLRAVPSKTEADRFSLQVEAADVTQVLDMLGQMAGWNVVVGPGVSGTVTLNLRDVTLDEALDAVLTPRGLVAERKDNLLFVLPYDEMAQRTAEERVVVTKVYRPSYISVQDIEALVTPILTPTIGKIAVTSPSETGLDLDNTTAGGDSLSQRDALVVQDYPDVIEQVDEIVLDMDVPPMQVVIEAYVLRVRLSDNMRFGVNFALLNGSGRQLVTSGRGFDVATTVGFPGEREDLVPPLGEFVSPLAAAGLRYGFLTGDVTGFIEALEGISETSLVASPSLRVLNKQKAELIIGQRLGYKTQTFNNQQTIENVEFLDVGTKLILRPFAAPDGLVRMEIHPERSTGFIDEKGLPQVDTTEVTTNVMVRDGATVVIGGLIDEQTEEDINQVPLLGSIPIVGAAFRNSEETLVRNELIVLITPRIVCDPIEEHRGETLRIETERRAAYFADKLSPISRRNLSRLHTERAEELFAEGRLVEAHDHTRHALSIRKNDGEAQRLKARIEHALKSKARRFLLWPGDPGPPPPLPAPEPELMPELVPTPDPFLVPELPPAPPGRAVVPGKPTLAPPAPVPETTQMLEPRNGPVPMPAPDG